MEDSESPKIFILLTKEELQILVYALSSTSPVSLEYEQLQYKLYQRLLSKLAEVK